MSVTERLDAYQRRHPAAGFPLAVLYKYFDDQGGYLAALITYYSLVSLFPLLLLLTTILGLVLRNNPELQQQVLDSALATFPVIGDDLGNFRQLGGGTWGLIIGVLGSLYGALGIAQVVQHAMNTLWAVPRNRRPNLLKVRLRGLLLLLTAGLAVLATTAISAIGAAGGAFGASLGIGFRVLLFAASVAVNTGIFTLTFRLATTRPLRVRDVAIGAIAAGLVWQLLQTFGSVYVTQVIQRASATSGVFALVLGLIAFIYLAATGILLCAQINVVRVRHLHPRALLTPFTDNVDLTKGDRATYAAQAKAQRLKGFQEVDVTFGPRPGRKAEDEDTDR